MGLKAGGCEVPGLLPGLMWKWVRDLLAEVHCVVKTRRVVALRKNSVRSADPVMNKVINAMDRVLDVIFELVNLIVQVVKLIGEPLLDIVGKVVLAPCC